MLQLRVRKFIFIMMGSVCLSTFLIAHNNAAQSAISMTFRPLSSKHELHPRLKKSGLKRRCSILQCTINNKSSLPYIYTAKPILGVKTYNLAHLAQKMYKKGWGEHVFTNMCLGVSSFLTIFSLAALSNPKSQNVLGGDIRGGALVLGMLSGGALSYLLYKMITNPRKMQKKKMYLRDMLEYYILNPNQQMVIPPHKSMSFLLFCSKKSDLDNLVIPFSTERLTTQLNTQ